MDRTYWDEKYRAQARLWSDEPNATLVAESATLSPGEALDFGCGEGADVLWLVARGWRVTGVDISNVALERAAAHAATCGEEIAARTTWAQADLATWAPAHAAFDLVTTHFMQFVAGERDALIRKLASAVAPGGTLLVVAHHPSDLKTAVRRPPMPELFYTADDVIASLEPGRWTIVASEARARTARDAAGADVTVRDALVNARRIA